MLKLVLKIILIFCLFPIQALAKCDGPVTYLLENQPACSQGYLFSPEKELEVRIKISQYDTLEKLTEKQTQLIDILNQRIENQMQQTLNLSKQLENQETTNYWKSAGFFILGSIITGYIALNVRPKY